MLSGGSNLNYYYFINCWTACEFSPKDQPTLIFIDYNLFVACILYYKSESAKLTSVF